MQGEEIPGQIEEICIVTCTMSKQICMQTKHKMVLYHHISRQIL